jgi:hypothetical protein
MARRPGKRGDEVTHSTARRRRANTCRRSGQRACATREEQGPCAAAASPASSLAPAAPAAPNGHQKRTERHNVGLVRTSSAVLAVIEAACVRHCAHRTACTHIHTPSALVQRPGAAGWPDLQLPLPEDVSSRSLCSVALGVRHERGANDTCAAQRRSAHARAAAAAARARTHGTNVASRARSSAPQRAPQRPVAGAPAAWRDASYPGIVWGRARTQSRLPPLQPRCARRAAGSPSQKVGPRRICLLQLLPAERGGRSPQLHGLRVRVCA